VYLLAHHSFYLTNRAEGLHLSAQTPLPGFLQMAYPIGTPHPKDFAIRHNQEPTAFYYTDLILLHLVIANYFNKSFFTMTKQQFLH
jgi:hypothetical protein